MQAYQYSLDSNRYLLKPLNYGNLPLLYFKEDIEYWSQFETESIYDMRLRKGGLGFYQIDMESINTKREVNKARFTLIFILGFELLCIYLCYALLTFYAIEDWSIFLQDIKNSNILLNGILGSMFLLVNMLSYFYVVLLGIKY